MKITPSRRCHVTGTNRRSCWRVHSPRILPQHSGDCCRGRPIVLYPSRAARGWGCNTTMCCRHSLIQQLAELFRNTSPAGSGLNLPITRSLSALPRLYLHVSYATLWSPQPSSLLDRSLTETAKQRREPRTQRLTENCFPVLELTGFFSSPITDIIPRHSLSSTWLSPTTAPSVGAVVISSLEISWPQTGWHLEKPRHPCRFEGARLQPCRTGPHIEPAPRPNSSGI